MSYEHYASECRADGFSRPTYDEYLKERNTFYNERVLTLIIRGKRLERIFEDCQAWLGNVPGEIVRALDENTNALLTGTKAFKSRFGETVSPYLRESGAE